MSILCKIGLHKWVYGYDLEQDMFGWAKMCTRCNLCKFGTAVMHEAQQFNTSGNGE
jgi:hypothetical protein